MHLSAHFHDAFTVKLHWQTVLQMDCPAPAHMRIYLIWKCGIWNALLFRKKSTWVLISMQCNHFYTCMKTHRYAQHVLLYPHLHMDVGYWVDAVSAESSLKPQIFSPQYHSAEWHSLAWEDTHAGNFGAKIGKWEQDGCVMGLLPLCCEFLIMAVQSAPGLIRSINRGNLVTCGNRVAVPCIYLCICTYANGGEVPQSECNTSNFSRGIIYIAYHFHKLNFPRSIFLHSFFFVSIFEYKRLTGDLTLTWPR